MNLDFDGFAGNLYSCHLDNLVIQNSDVIIDGDNGEHLLQKSFDDVKAITVSKTHFHYFPQGIGTIFKNIEAVKVENSSLKVVTRNDLQQFPNLKGLWLEQNKLQSLESGLLQFNPEIRILNFADNKIDFVASNILDFQNLEKVDLSNNDCIKSAKAKNRKEIEDLKKKILESCQLSSDSNKNANLVKVTSVLILIALSVRSFV